MGSEESTEATAVLTKVVDFQLNLLGFEAVNKGKDFCAGCNGSLLGLFFSNWLPKEPRFRAVVVAIALPRSSFFNTFIAAVS